MPDLHRHPPQFFDLPEYMLRKAVLNTVNMLHDEPELIPDMLEALGLTHIAQTMVV